MAEMKRSLEAILSWLLSNLGPSHPIAALYSATYNFVANLLHQPFVPRLLTIHQLEKFVNSQSCGSVLVYAPAGFGKTTLVARWSAGREDWLTAMHFFSRAPEFLGLASSPSIAFAHLLAQIFAIRETQWGEFINKPKFSIPETYNERASLLCETVANLKPPKGGKLLVLLDGIDEADEPFLSPFPDQLPEGVFVVISARWDGKSEMPYLSGWKFDERIRLDLMDESEIAEWLKCYGSGELKVLAEDKKFIATLKRTTEGLPLFLRFVLDELTEKVKLGEPISAFEVPKGFSTYIREQVQRIAASSWDGIPLTDLIALLAVSKGAIRQDEISQVLNIPIEALSYLPNIVARWLRINRSPITHLPTHRPSELLSFAFTHPLLASEFAKAVGEKAKEVEARLIAWCEKWQEHKSNYALRYLDEHLRSIGEFEKLWTLAMNDEWVKVHNEIFPEEPESSLKAVRNGLEASIERENAVMMAKMLLRHVELLGRLETPMEALRRGNVERALKLAALAIEQDPSAGILWHLMLAWTWHQRGEIENAQKALRQLLKTWRQGVFVASERSLRFLFLEPLLDLPEAMDVAKLMFAESDWGDLAEKWAKEGKWEQALELTRNLGKSYLQARLLSIIAAEMAKAGKVEEAEQLFAKAEQKAMMMKEHWELSFALAELIKALWEAGWEQKAEKVVEEAIKMIQQKDAKTRIFVLIELGKLLAEKGKQEQTEKCLQIAKEKIKEIEVFEEQVLAMSEIAQILVLVEQRQELEEVVNKIINEYASICPYCCSTWLCKIADKAIKIGWNEWAKLLLQKAKEFAENMSDEHELGQAFGEIAKMLVKVGLFEDAKLLATTRENSWERLNIWQGIAIGLVKLGLYEEAMEIANKIENFYHKVNTLITLIRKIAAKGEIRLVKQIFEQIEKLRIRYDQLLEIAMIQLQIGLIYKALITIEKALNLKQKERQEARWEALRMIVEFLVEYGQLENAEAIAQIIKNSWKKLQALEKLILVFLQIGQQEKIKSILKQIANLSEVIINEGACTYDRQEFFESIFVHILEMGQQEAVDIVLSEVALACPNFLNEVKEIAARVMSEKGQMGKAFEIARSITNPENRAWALIAVARALAKAGEKGWAKEIIEEVWSLSGQAPISVHCIRCEVVKELAELSEWEVAMQRLESVKSSWYDWMDAVKFLAKEAARQGKVTLAKQIVEEFCGEELKIDVWTDLIEAFKNTGNEEETKKAFEIARKLAMQSYNRDDALAHLALIVATLGWIEEAKSLLEVVEEDRRQEVISNIVNVLIIQNKPELAEIFAAESNDAYVWMLIGEGWGEMKQMEKAKSAFEKAMNLAKQSEFEEIAKIMIVVGFIDEGIKLLEGMWSSKLTLQNVFENLVKRGDRKNFLKLLPRCRWDMELAYEASGWLAKLYPEQAMEIANMLSEA